jgi:hypothetical protein
MAPTLVPVQAVAPLGPILKGETQRQAVSPIWTLAGRVSRRCNLRSETVSHDARRQILTSPDWELLIKCVEVTLSVATVCRELVQHHLHAGQDSHRGRAAGTEARWGQVTAGQIAQQLIELGHAFVEPVEDLGKVRVCGWIEPELGLILD